jgi:hypothetical protein
MIRTLFLPGTLTLCVKAAASPIGDGKAELTAKGTNADAGEFVPMVLRK